MISFATSEMYFYFIFYQKIVVTSKVSLTSCKGARVRKKIIVSLVDFITVQ